MGVLCTTSFSKQSIESSSNLAPVSRLYKMGGLSIVSESWLFLLSPYTLLTGYSFSHPWHLVSVSSSQYYQVILFDVPISLKIVCLESISYPVPCPVSHVSVLFWSLNHLSLFRVDLWRIPQCLPSTDFILSTSTHYPRLKSRNLSVPWCLQPLVASFPVFNNEFSSMNPARMSLWVFDINSFIHT